ncbi:HPP family protein [Vibrio kyushuensis]|uniref:HPP family protein n=1 Tax=Vibrio kyushuensis TaxID=2910249 RepID=UPI003D0B3E85
MNKFINAITAGIGASVAIFLLACLHEFYSYPSDHMLWLMAPFGATTVLVFGLPNSPLAQPKNVILGHLITSFIGLIFVSFISVDFWALALATGLGVTAMLATDTTHPPAGANPMLIMMLQPTWSFLINPVLFGAVLIVLVGWLYARTANVVKE